VSIPAEYQQRLVLSQCPFLLSTCKDSYSARVHSCWVPAKTRTQPVSIPAEYQQRLVLSPCPFLLSTSKDSYSASVHSCWVPECDPCLSAFEAHCVNMRCTNGRILYFTWRGTKSRSITTIINTIYLRALKSWQNGQLSLAHGTETKIKELKTNRLAQKKRCRQKSV